MASGASDLCPSSSIAASIYRSSSTLLDYVFCRLGLLRGGRTAAAADEGAVDVMAGERSTDEGLGVESRASICAAEEYLPYEQEVYEDLCFRFVLNTPKDDRPFFVRMLFNIEDAHCYYEDHLVQNSPSLKTQKFEEFAKQMFIHCAPLRPYIPRTNEILKQFYDYKNNVPINCSVRAFSLPGVLDMLAEVKCDSLSTV